LCIGRTDFLTIFRGNPKKHVSRIPFSLSDPFFGASLTAGILENRIFSNKVRLGCLGETFGGKKCSLGIL